MDHIQWATQSIERDPSTFNYAPRASPVKTQGILSYNLLVLLFTQGKLYQLSFVNICKLICESDCFSPFQAIIIHVEGRPTTDWLQKLTFGVKIIIIF